MKEPVPSSWNPPAQPIMPPVLMAALTERLISRSRAGSATLTSPVPRTATAFSFLEPITAPGPPRAAARWPSFMTAAISERCSPAGPMHAARTLGSSSFSKAACVSLASSPHTLEASRISTLPSLIQIMTGFFEAPDTNTPS